jgi:2-polyprenyl-3-methyl-5-hydroxy-6-metoxy-1,4-benzoquinol methylase
MRHEEAKFDRDLIDEEAHMTKEVLASQEYWETRWEAAGPQRGFNYFDELAAHLPPRAGLDFLEIGCAPGGILAEFCGRLGYVAHGVDYASAPEPITAYLQREGVRVGQIYQADFLTWEPAQQYDVVASFGFIEHFEDAAKVVDRHFHLCRPGGTVILTVPNFGRGQKVLHWLFDRENLRRHNTRCMSIGFFRAAARRQQATLLASRYTGGPFGFWCEEQPRSWWSQRLMWRSEAFFEQATRLLRLPSNGWLSPHLYAVYRLAS